MSVLAAVRNPEDRVALEREGRDRVTPILLDISRDDSIQCAAETVRANSLGNVTAEDRPRFEGAVQHFKTLNRRMMATAAPADRVAATIQRAITARRPRARYHCGWEQKAVSWLKRLTTERVRDAIVARMIGL